jgi:hypothetical protein
LQITLEVFKELVMIRLNFKEYLQEKGSLAIDPKGSQDPTHSEE